MREDPAVNRLKYDREIARLREQESTLQSRGIFVLNPPKFPAVEIVYVPRHSLRLAVPAPQQGAIILPAGAMAVIEFPNLAAKAVKARFDLGDYDLGPTLH